MSKYTILNLLMNNSFSLQQIQKTSNLDANLISRQYKINPMADFMRVKYENPKMKQSGIATLISLSSSSLQRYRNVIKKLSLSRINTNNTNKRKKASNPNFDNNSHHEHDLKTTSNENIKNKKNQLKGGSSIQINEHYLDENFHNNNT